MYVVVLLFFILITIKKIKDIKNIEIFSAKTYLQIVIVISVFAVITYLYANKNTHYILAITASMMFITMWLAQGITSDGFLSNYKHKQFIKWDEISKVVIFHNKNIKIQIIGDFMEQNFYFKNDDYKKIINVLNQKLPAKTQINQKY